MPAAAVPSQLELAFSEQAGAPDLGGWRAPPFIPAADPMGQALLIAAQGGDTRACHALLSAGHRFDFNRAEPPSGPRGGQEPLAGLPLILLASSTANRGRYADAFSDEPVSLMLEMIARGASLLAEDGAKDTPIAALARAGRQEMFTALEGHPEFNAASLEGLWSAPPKQSHRAPLMGFLVGRGFLTAAKALVEGAGLDPNQLDPAGRLPIGYCRDEAAFAALIAMGADPGAVDAEGKNALARAQGISDTQERERVSATLSKIAMAKAKASGSPADLDKLREDNVATALSAARDAPKSSMLRAISSFKFVPSLTRDPKTGSTMLMEAVRGGRMASAQWLMERGCKLTDQDLAGLSAGALLLAGHSTTQGPTAEEVAMGRAAQFDPKQRSGRGWPVAVEAAWRVGETILEYPWSWKPVGQDLLAKFAQRRRSMGMPLAPADFVGGDGTTLVEAYWGALPYSAKDGDFRPHVLLALCKLQFEEGADPRGYDTAAAAAVGAAAAEPDDEDECPSEAAPALSALAGYTAGKFLAEMDKSVSGAAAPMPLLAKALEAKPAWGDAFARECPTLHALAEAGALSKIPDPGKASSFGRRI